MKLIFYRSFPDALTTVSSWAERSGVELLRRRSKSAMRLRRSGIFFAMRPQITLKIFTWFSLCSKKQVSQKAFPSEGKVSPQVTKEVFVYLLALATPLSSCLRQSTFPSRGRLTERHTFSYRGNIMQFVLAPSGDVWQKGSRFDASISRFCHRYRVAKSSTSPAFLLFFCP